MPLAKTVAGLARHFLRGRRGLLLLGSAAVLAGMALNWNWFVAVGLAPIILGVAPCLAMCALGLCMNKMTSGKSCSTESKPGAPDATPSVAKTSVPPVLDVAPLDEAQAPKGEKNA